jgi:cellulose synthase/poly-beta-1,6-N-acetylglucosamine synthase-like glycosyltransferase
MARLTKAYDLAPAPRFPMAALPTAEVREVYRSRRHSNLWVIDKVNGGKADALNAGLNYSRTPLFCAMDADSMLERDSLLRLARAFIEDASMVAAGGIIRIANGCLVQEGEVREVRLPRNPIAGFQVIEYLRGFLVGRVGWAAINSTLVISGAFGMFRRSAVVEAGGFDTTTVGEDMELVVRLHRHFREKGEPYRIGFIPDPVAWTEAPESLEQLGKQRDRWQRGLIEALTRHLPMLFNPRYGRIGMVAFPYFFFLEMLGPFIEMGGYFSFAFLVANRSISVPYMIAFLSLAIVFGLTLSLTAVLMEEMTFRRYPRKRDLLHLFILAIVENFGYRQLTFYWRFKGSISKLWKTNKWGDMKRKGFQTVTEGGTR